VRARVERRRLLLLLLPCARPVDLMLLVLCVALAKLGMVVDLAIFRRWTLLLFDHYLFDNRCSQL